ncbi:hypothetical protein ROHU_024824 [Labeo rohita]|uniref:Uncharacterized protein n=1 Tax=Labeo rohita TaxID=84645 RepID=A0A498MMF6_LABRO|nr:hypothetical protein ROHU_024824 [Labeo rohita]
MGGVFCSKQLCCREGVHNGKRRNNRPPLGYEDRAEKSERVVPYGVTCKHGQIITPPPPPINARLIVRLSLALGYVRRFGKAGGLGEALELLRRRGRSPSSGPVTKPHTSWPAQRPVPGSHL